MMDIPRDDLIGSLMYFAARGSGLVVGSPGVGKTHALKQLPDRLKEQDLAYLYLPIDKLGVENERQLREVLGIDKDITTFLRDQVVTGPIRHGVLIVDAFDAAFSQVSQSFFLSLVAQVIHQLQDSWHVVVSVRTYDAQKSTNLQGLFPQRQFEQPPGDYQSSSISCRHFVVPALGIEEVKGVVTQSEAMFAIYQHGSADLRHLLRIPFNLWLMERLLSSHPNPLELSSVTSEVQLLELFWKQRITSNPLGHDMRRLLSRVTQAMVAQRSLSVPTDDGYELGGNDAWDHLFSSELLAFATESMQRVTFVHNILFDYAVSVLLMADNPEELLRFLVGHAANNW